MHFFIDIRATDPSRTINRRYAEAWVQLWKKYHTSDTFSFLIYEWQERKDSTYIVVPKPSWMPWKKTISGDKKGLFRSINFSDFPPYDPSIPTVSHIFDNASWLYPESKNTSYVARKTIEQTKKKIVEKSIATIVPNMSTGSELVELWHAKEAKIEIIPYIPMSWIPEDPGIFSQFGIEKPYFIYDATYGNEANLAGLLKGFETYRHGKNGKKNLILHGFPGDELSHITQMIRTFDIGNSVKFIGQLSEAWRESLYKNGSGWIYAGGYYGWWPTIELAEFHKLPLLLSDIKIFDDYTGIKLHPNHIDELGEMLDQLENYSYEITEKHHEQTFVKVYEKIISRSE